MTAKAKTATQAPVKMTALRNRPAKEGVPALARGENFECAPRMADVLVRRGIAERAGPAPTVKSGE